MIGLKLIQKIWQRHGVAYIFVSILKQMKPATTTPNLMSNVDMIEKIIGNLKLDLDYFVYLF